jgi:membrane associated rhomboid family serine protease
VDHVLRTTASPTQAGDWALVLTAASIAHRVDQHDGHFALVVDAVDAPAATEALAGFDEEGEPEQPPPAPDLGWSPLGVLCSIGFAAMLWRTGTWSQGSPWFSAGAASSDAILHGAWWRAVTALTLHADLWHLVGNIVASLVFISSVGRWLGGGLGALLILASATAGNLLTAVRHHAHSHLSVGASTATFAAIGLTAGLQVARRLRVRNRPGYVWLPIGAGLALFAMIGVGSTMYGEPEPDYWAHLFGLGFGILFGVGWALAQLKRGWRAPGPIVQGLLGAVALAAVVGCWALAFRHAG